VSVRGAEHGGLVRVLLVASALSFALGFFALPPLYRIACELLGIRLGNAATEAERIASFEVDESRTVIVEFDGSVNSKLPWSFRPKFTRMEVHPGRLYETQYLATNLASESVVGNAVPSVAPNAANLYFLKTECFCFTEQLLRPGESREMPVRFVIDPALPREVRTLTLSYVFFRNDVATEREQRADLALAGSPRPES
jgi:cytochrome c oxidase assembly protein subunit 11